LGIPGLFTKFANKMNSEITIVVRMSGGEESTGKCLVCLLRQNFENWKVILVDGCSTDDTCEWVKRPADQPERKGIKETFQKRGTVAARNLGIR